MSPRPLFNVAEGAWILRAGVEDRIRKTLEGGPSEAIRREALGFVAFAIENADEERHNAWYLKETERGLRLMTGRMIACELEKSKIRISVIGPVTDDVRSALGSDVRDDEEFKSVPGGFLLTVPAEHAAKTITLLGDAFGAGGGLWTCSRGASHLSLQDSKP